MSNPTLIEGFEDVMQHIRNQEKRIQELEKNNETIKKMYLHKSSEYETLKKQKESESYKKKNEHLIQQKRDLETKLQNAEVVYQENILYKREIDTLKNAVEEECEASGIMEVMNMRIQDAEDKAREQEVLKVIAEKELEKEVFEKIKLHKEINELEYALEKAELCKCDQCSEYCPLAEIEDCFGENYQCDMVCLECRDEHYTQCDECMDYHHNSNITTIGERQVCSKCQEEDEE